MKYKNKKVTLNGIEFDSKKEAQRYGQLLLMQRAGHISDLELQKEYELIPSQYVNVCAADGTVKRRCAERAVKYVADFAYKCGGETIVEDVKGYRDPKGGAYAKFVLKRKLMLYVHGIRVREI